MSFIKVFNDFYRTLVNKVNAITPEKQTKIKNKK